MKKLTLLTIALLTSIILLTAPTQVTRAAVGTYTPAAGATFNNPHGNDAEQYKIFHKIIDAVDHTPKGNMIRIATYSIDSGWATDRLIAAHQRGVNVRFVIDNHASAGSPTASPGMVKQLNRLKAELGTDTTKLSYIKICTYSCMSSDPTSMMHAKFYLFSNSGDAGHVVDHVAMMGSSNLTGISATEAWNNIYTTVRDIPTYDAYVAYFDAMTKDKNTAVYNKTVASDIYKIYFYPDDRSATNPDNLLQILKNVSCTGAAPGYGTKGATNVRVAMYRWSDARADLADQLWKMDDQGCDVQVIYGSNAVGYNVFKSLLKSGGKHGGVQLYKSSYSSKSPYYVHNKYFVINGKYLTDSSSRIVFTSSGNFDYTSLSMANENMLKISSDAAYDAYIKNYYLIRDNYSSRQTTLPPSPARTTDGKIESQDSTEADSEIE